MIVQKYNKLQLKLLFHFYFPFFTYSVGKSKFSGIPLTLQ